MNKDNSFKIIGFVVWGICALFYLYEFLLRTVVGTFQYSIMNELHLSSVKFSFLSSTVFMIIYGLMQIPISMIVNRLGLKKSMLIGIMSCTLSTITFGYSYSYPFAIASRMLMGFGASFGFVCMLVAVYEWMPHRLSGLFMGLSQFIGTMGPMFAAGPLESLSNNQGSDWRNIFFYLGFFGFFLTLLIFLFVRNNAETTGKFIILKRSKNSISDILKLFMRAELWKIAAFSALIYFSVEYLSENEGKSFIVQKGFNSGFAAYMITLSWVGYAIGSPLFGYISDFISRRRTVMIIAALFAVIGLTGFVFSSNMYVLIVSFLLIGVSASCQSVTFAIVAEQFKKENVVFGFGLNNTLITSLVGLNAPILGFLIDTLKADNISSHDVYMKVFIILIFFAVVSLVLAIRIKETFCKSQAGFTYLNTKKLDSNA